MPSNWRQRAKTKNAIAQTDAVSLISSAEAFSMLRFAIPGKPRSIRIRFCIQCFIPFCAVASAMAQQPSAEILLIPSNPGPYFGGESLTIDVWLRNNDASSHDIRLIQFDIQQTQTYQPALAAGGTFSDGSGVEALNIAKWESGSWQPLGLPGSGVNGPVYAIKVFDDGTGPAIYVGGDFTEAYNCSGCPPIAVANLAKWTGEDWQSVGGGTSGAVYALETFKDSYAPALFVGGGFGMAGGQNVFFVAKWDGSAWSSLEGGGVGKVYALKTMDLGTGPQLYAAGGFSSAGGRFAQGVASWNGTHWRGYGRGLYWNVFDVESFDDGSNVDLFAGGAIELFQPEADVAKWDGVNWLPVGGGFPDPSAFVNTLEVFGSTGNEELYAAGSFNSVGGISANNIAKWDGVAWRALGLGVNDEVQTFASHDDGSGTDLYAGGDFTVAGSFAAQRVARWDGRRWTSLENGVNGPVHCLSSRIQCRILSQQLDQVEGERSA